MSLGYVVALAGLGMQAAGVGMQIAALHTEDENLANTFYMLANALQIVGGLMFGIGRGMALKGMSVATASKATQTASTRNSLDDINFSMFTRRPSSNGSISSIRSLGPGVQRSNSLPASIRMTVSARNSVSSSSSGSLGLEQLVGSVDDVASTQVSPASSVSRSLSGAARPPSPTDHMRIFKPVQHHSIPKRGGGRLFGHGWTSKLFS